MKRGKVTRKKRGEDILYILNSLRNRFDVFGYLEFLTSPKYDHSAPIEKLPTEYRVLDEESEMRIVRLLLPCLCILNGVMKSCSRKVS